VIAGEWIRVELPRSWGVARLRDQATVVNGYPFDSESFSTDTGLPLVRIRDIASVDTEVRYAGDVVPEALLKGGEILVGMDGDFKVARWRGGEALLNQRVCSVRPFTTVDGRFLYYVLPAPLVLINEFTYSTTVKHLSSFDVLKFRFPFPPLAQQHAIADYLDRETARLDALVAAKERVLELLAEKRRALITSAVTRGLDPRAPVRDSGVPWLGDIPAHWAVRRAAWLFRERDERGEAELPLLEVSINAGVILREFSDERIESTAADFNTYKVARQGDVAFNKMRMWQGAVGVATQDGLVSPDYVVAEPTGELSSGYAGLLFRTEMFSAECARGSHGIVWDRLRLYWEGFREIELPLPSAEEQREIVGQIARETAKLDKVRQATDHSVALLKERRAALIAAAVTGVIDVSLASSNRSADSPSELNRQPTSRPEGNG